MAAPSRSASLGVTEANPDDSNVEELGLTKYEVLRNRRKEALHAQIQLSLVTEGVVLDKRVLRGFDGKPALQNRSTPQIHAPLKEGIAPGIGKSTEAARTPLRRSQRRRESGGEVPPAPTSVNQPTAVKVLLLPSQQ
jgi:hypothetical protein